MQDRSKDLAFVQRLSIHMEGYVRMDSAGAVARCWCPICGDADSRIGKRIASKKRFYFLSKGNGISVYCHKCGFSASLPWFLKQYHSDIFEDYIFQNFKRKGPSLKEQLKDKCSKPEFNTEDVYDLDSCIPIHKLPENHFVVRYVKNRQIPFDKIMLCPDINKVLLREQRLNKTVPTLIIPYYRRDMTCRVFQVRFFDPKIKPKYLSFKYDDDDEKIYNMDFVDTTNPVYVLEGPIDAMMVDNAVAVGGSNQNSVDVPNQVIVFDNEPRHPQICQKIKNTIDAGKKVVIWPKNLKEKDPNEMIMAGVKGIDKILKDNTVQGLQAKLRFNKWKKVHYLK